MSNSIISCKKKFLIKNNPFEIKKIKKNFDFQIRHLKKECENSNIYQIYLDKCLTSIIIKLEPPKTLKIVFSSKQLIFNSFSFTTISMGDSIENTLIC